jgi:hypothetical protein
VLMKAMVSGVMATGKAITSTRYAQPDGTL